ncbi:MAG: glycosyltransferase [Chloroflexi bacterium HGW-Chloroflexi-8]|jgi:N-acetylglucosaminyldiphosphoundecaprenol N-acetyl-beta-D-mannosaminyltransferase|nr:MAG: glycosyltransferase [Chloroflexi bacterium HGW-Chloroflexi-8]
MIDTVSKCNILGVGISIINMSQTLVIIEDWIENNNHQYVCVTPIHAIMNYQNNPNLLKIANQSGLTTPDGMPVVWLLKLAGYKNVSRVYGPDLMLAVCENGCKKNYRHYMYGSTTNVLLKLTDHLQNRFPGLIISGSYSPPFRILTDEEDQEIINQINSVSPDIVWVGIGSPKQELWMAEHLNKINAKVMIGVGAAFDFHAGHIKQAPLWMQRSGLEWLFRLILEPKRLWKRYLIGYPKFVFLIIREIILKKK